MIWMILSQIGESCEGKHHGAAIGNCTEEDKVIYDGAKCNLGKVKLETMLASGFPLLLEAA